MTLICLCSCTQQWQDGGVNCIIGEVCKFDVAVQAPMLDLLGGLSRRHFGLWAECLHLQEFVVRERLEGAAEIRIGLSRNCLGAFDEGLAI